MCVTGSETSADAGDNANLSLLTLQHILHELVPFVVTYFYKKNIQPLCEKKQHYCGGKSVNMTINTPIAGTHDLRVKSRVAVVHMEKKTNHNMPEMVDT